MIRAIFLLILAVMAVFSRLIPHPANFTPIAALALFGGVYFEKKYAFILPLAVLLVSDAIIGFYDGIGWVYGSFLIIGLLGLWLRNHRSIRNTAGVTLAGSVIFFILTNFGVWLAGGLYMPTTAGLVECYVVAVPFFRNTLAGDLFYVAVLFGITEMAARRIPALGLPGGDSAK
ncbi:MAG TPA: DUF6580 family putative transport protein [Bacteroidota bacterium]|nr:DUF6580 family putative transport protein [Bacteroidota bacterium]